MNLSKEQINIYKKLRELAEPHHAYTDQLMAMAIWIDTEYSNKNSVMSDIISESDKPITDQEAIDMIKESIVILNKGIKDKRTTLVAFMDHYKNNVPLGTFKSSNEIVDDYLAYNQISSKSMIQLNE